MAQDEIFFSLEFSVWSWELGMRGIELATMTIWGYFMKGGVEIA
jgi:hypothetical protein